MVQYINVLGPEHEIKQNLQVKTRDWIPKSASVPPMEIHETFTNIEDTINSEYRLLNLIDLHTKRKSTEENSMNSLKQRKSDVKEKETIGQIAEIFTEDTANQCKREETTHVNHYRKKKELRINGRISKKW